jgi:hypothetical protein
MTITKVLVAPRHGLRQLRHRGGPGGRQIARCVGDVDKSTFSENLGCRRQAVRDRRPQKLSGATGSEWWAEAFVGSGGDLSPPIAIMESTD